MSKAKKIIICVLGACLVACSGLTAFATQTIYVNTSRPQTSDTLSYIELYMTNPASGEYMGIMGVYVINTEPSGSTVFILTGNNTAEIRSSNILYGYWSDLVWNTWNTVTGSGGSQGSGGSTLSLWFNPDVFKISAVRVYGSIRNTSTITTGDYTICYGEDKIICERLDSIVSLLQQQNANTDKITSNADKNASNIQSNDDKNTQAIIDNQNQLAEQEKTETQNSGNNSVNDVSGSVPDKSAGMLSALQSLSNAVSYTGTTAKWTFPQMYIPAISGVTDRINLNPEMEIDFSYWINQIPQDIRTIISALATIGLVIFAFKELYGLISYVLTLKGGGNNE